MTDLLGHSGSEAVAWTLGYWRSKARRRPPTRADVDPLEIPPAVLPHLMLTDLVGPERRPRYRLIGGAVTAAAGLSPVGRFADEVLAHPPYRAYILSLYADALEHGGPFFAKAVHSVEGRWTRTCERLVLPLAGPDGAPATMLIVQDYEGDGASRPLALAAEPAETREVCRLRLPASEPADAA